MTYSESIRLLSGVGAASTGPSPLSKSRPDWWWILANVTLRETVTPTIGELLLELERGGKSGALAFGIVAGRLIERESGAKVVVRARFGAATLDLEHVEAVQNGAFAQGLKPTTVRLIRITLARRSGGPRCGKCRALATWSA